MPYTPAQIKHLKSAAFVGDKVLQRLVEMGIDDIGKLQRANEDAILQMGGGFNGVKLLEK